MIIKSAIGGFLFGFENGVVEGMIDLFMSELMGYVFENSIGHAKGQP